MFLRQLFTLLTHALPWHTSLSIVQDKLSNGTHPVESPPEHQSKQSTFEQMLAAGANSSASDALAAAGKNIGKLRNLNFRMLTLTLAKALLSEGLIHGKRIWSL